MKKRRAASVVGKAKPAQRTEMKVTRRGAGAEDRRRADLRETADRDESVMQGWFSVDNLYAGDMELRMMPVQVKLPQEKSAAPRKLERFSLFYQSDSSFRYALPEERA